MTDFFRDLLSTNGFHPHGYCYLGRADLIWLHVVSDALIGLAYVGIGTTLAGGGMKCGSGCRLVIRPCFVTLRR